MAKNAEGCDAKVFQKVALVSMCVLAAAAATGVVRDILRNLRRKDDCDGSTIAAGSL